MHSALAPTPTSNSSKNLWITGTPVFRAVPQSDVRKGVRGAELPLLVSCGIQEPSRSSQLHRSWL
jgi:hypothetical protein